MDAPHVVVCTTVGAARGGEAAAAALAVAHEVADERSAGSILLDLRAAARPPRGTLLASASARGLEETCRGTGELRAAARGRLLFATPAQEPEGAEARLPPPPALDPALGASLVACVCDPRDFRAVLACEGGVRAALVRADPAADRALVGLLADELLADGVALKVWTRPLGLVPARRALAGLEPGGESGRRAARFATRLTPSRRRPAGRPWRALGTESAQAMPAILGVALLVLAVALTLLAIGSAATAKGRMQRSADLAAISAARSMRDDFPRLFEPSELANGLPNPAHLDRAEYLGRAEEAALEAAERNGLNASLVDVGFPDRSSFAPLRVRIDARGEIEVDGRADEGGAEAEVSAKAEVTPPTASLGGGSGQPATASGGGYGGPLAYRQGKPMRPDVAAAFDRMAAAAAADGVTLVVNSGYRSDAEQAALYAANPDPRMVAPPGTSLHRCGTELDLGPPAAYGWLASNASRFGFVQRYSWEAWHHGYTAGPEPCSAQGESGGLEKADADGRLAGSGGLPGFVPEGYRQMILGAAARWDVSAALLAAQLMAESNFNPNAGSPAGAQGIAQFMPATAQAYGLEDPYDPEQAIDAQAQLMSDLLRQFGSVELALAAYNAGPGAVSGCNCIPPYPETQAYVTRIMGLLDGAGELVVPPAALEVRLVA